MPDSPSAARAEAAWLVILALATALFRRLAQRFAMKRVRCSVLTRTCSGLRAPSRAGSSPPCGPSTLSPSGCIFPRRSADPTPSSSAAPTARTIARTKRMNTAPIPTAGAYPLPARPNDGGAREHGPCVQATRRLRRRGGSRRSGLGHLVQRHGGGDVREVRQRLGIVAQQLAVRGVDLLGEEAERPRRRDRLLEDLTGRLGASLARVALGQPEGAGQERTLAPLEAIGAPVTADEAVFAELPAHRIGRAHHALVVEGDEAEQGQQQQRAVELAVTEATDEDAALAVVSPRLDRLADPRAGAAPASHRGLAHALLGEAQPAVDGRPAAGLGVHEVP